MAGAAEKNDWRYRATTSVHLIGAVLHGTGQAWATSSNIPVLRERRTTRRGAAHIMPACLPALTSCKTPAMTSVTLAAESAGVGEKHLACGHTTRVYTAARSLMTRHITAISDTEGRSLARCVTALLAAPGGTSHIFCAAHICISCATALAADNYHKTTSHSSPHAVSRYLLPACSHRHSSWRSTLDIRLSYLYHLPGASADRRAPTSLLRRYYHHAASTA